MQRAHWIPALAVAAAFCAGCTCHPSDSAASPEPEKDSSRPDVTGLVTGPELYRALCTSCHGETGEADGPGAQSLYPPARNLRRDRFRLVSTENHVPTRDDIERVIELGMPGTSMRAYSELSARQRELLVDEVLRLRREGIEERARGKLPQAGTSDDGETVVVVPLIGPREQAATLRGKNIYFCQGCQACHGMDGVGAVGLRLLTDEGVPTRGRDLVHEPFKGGHSAESIYLRIALGMPGTPMPASPTLTPGELADLVHFCQSLSREPKRELTNYQRAQQATGEAYLNAQRQKP